MKNTQTFTVSFNHQQLALLDVFIDKDPTLSGYEDLVKRAIDEAAVDNKTANDNENLQRVRKRFLPRPSFIFCQNTLLNPGRVAPLKY